MGPAITKRARLKEGWTMDCGVQQSRSPMHRCGRDCGGKLGTSVGLLHAATMGADYFSSQPRPHDMAGGCSEGEGGWGLAIFLGCGVFFE